MRSSLVTPESPDTFFGTYEPKRQLKDPGELYEWLLSAYRRTPRERVLEFMVEHPDIEPLRKLPQIELAKVYADRAASSIVARQGNPTR